MNKRKRILGLIVVTAVVCAITIFPIRTNAANIPGRIKSMMKSKGVLKYDNPSLGDTIIVDTSDFYLMAEELDNLNTIMGR